jgi:hypothetical protein
MHIVFKGVLAYGCISAMFTTLWIMVGMNIRDRKMARQEDVVRARRRQERVKAL